jgi:PAS domain S-box-containing protein
MLDPQGAIVTWNSAAERIKGYTLEEVRGKHFRLLFTEADRQAGIPETELRVAAEAGKYLGDGFRLRKDGTQFIANVSMSALRDEQGTLKGFVKVTHDITERVRAQRGVETMSEASAALTSSFHEQAMLSGFASALLKNFADIVSIDFIDERGQMRHGLVAHADPDMAARLREHRARFAPQLAKHPIAAVMDGRGRIVEDLTELLQGSAIEPETRVLAAGLELRSLLVLPLLAGTTVFGCLLAGSRLHKHFSARDLQLGEELARRLSLALDNARLTERAQAGEHRLLMALEAGQMGAWEWEIAANQVNWSPTLEDIHGIPRGSFSGTFEAYQSDMHPEDKERVLATLQATLQTGAPYLVLYRIVRPDGQIRWLEARAELIRDSANQPLRVVGVCMDVSERKRAQDELTESEQRLARLYLSEQEARKSADLANRAKDDFLATVSHELRTPLNAMLGWTRLMRDGGLSHDKREHALRTIERNALTQVQLIEDLLDVSRIISGNLSLELAPFELKPVIEQVLDSLRPSSDAKQLHIVSDVDPSAGRILGDSSRVQQVVWNLLSNAIKFTPPGGHIRLSLEHDDEHVCFSVTDSGCGIEPAFLPHVFERFRQADGTTTRAHGGLGLGLAISRHIVELHRGRIEASSAGPGQGATFRVSLPRSTARSNASHELPARPAARGAQSERLAGLKILIVDDDADGRELIAAVLERSGARVTATQSADEALREIQRETPDILLSDIGMPGSDGYDLIRSVRALAPHPSARVPAAALTGFARAEDHRKALDAGFTMHMTKPIEPAELVAVVIHLSQLGSGR